MNSIPKWMSPTLRLYRSYPLVPVGAMEPGYDISTVDARSGFIPMHFVLYTTFHKVNGLLSMERTEFRPDQVDPVNQLYFFGYHCLDCNEVFLVPDSVKDESDLGKAMRHGCSDGR